MLNNSTLDLLHYTMSNLQLFQDVASVSPFAHNYRFGYFIDGLLYLI